MAYEKNMLIILFKTYIYFDVFCHILYFACQIVHFRRLFVYNFNDITFVAKVIHAYENAELMLKIALISMCFKTYLFSVMLYG